MPKYIALFFLSMMLIVSCTTQRAGDAYTDDEKSGALRVLGDDMIDSVEGTTIAPEAFYEILPVSYVAYREYSPVFESLATAYVEKLSAIVTPMLDDIYPILRSSIDEASRMDIDLAIYNPEGFTDNLQEITAREIYQLLLDGIAEERESIDEAYAESGGVFESIKIAYQNLSSVGVDVSLPDPQPIQDDAIAFAAENYLYTMLGDAESRLKRRLPESNSSPYAVFWEVAL